VIRAFTLCASILLLLSDHMLSMIEKNLSTGADAAGKQKKVYQLRKFKI